MGFWLTRERSSLTQLLVVLSWCWRWRWRHVEVSLVVFCRVRYCRRGERRKDGGWQKQSSGTLVLIDIYRCDRSDDTYLHYTLKSKSTMLHAHQHHESIHPIAYKQPLPLLKYSCATLYICHHNHHSRVDDLRSTQIIVTTPEQQNSPPASYGNIFYILLGLVSMLFHDGATHSTSTSTSTSTLGGGVIVCREWW